MSEMKPRIVDIKIV